MLERLTISQFQAHAKTVIEFDRHVTVITGPTDVGKTAILRALRWLCLNKPNGDAFIRHGAAGVKVRLEVDGHVITRRRGKVGNTYTLDDQKYQAMGNTVPPAIAELLNVSELNFQLQHDSPFWFSLSDGQVSRELNTIVNLGVIDSTLSNVAKELRTATAELTVCRDRLHKARDQRDQLAWTRDADVKMGKIVAVEEQQRTATSRRAALGELLTGVLRAVEQRKLASQTAVDAAALLRRGRGTAKIAKTANRRARALRALLSQIEEQERELWFARRDVAKATAQLQTLASEICPTCGKTIGDQ